MTMHANEALLQKVFGGSVIFDPVADESFQPVMVLIPDLIQRVAHARQLNLCEFSKVLYRV
jgi:hypothetical protein